jgi:hypothetical protein
MDEEAGTRIATNTTMNMNLFIAHPFLKNLPKPLMLIRGKTTLEGEPYDHGRSGRAATACSGESGRADWSHIEDLLLLRADYTPAYTAEDVM